MKDFNNPDNDHDYSPNELAHLSIDNPKKYRSIVEQNLDCGDTIEQWQKRNMKFVQCYLGEKNKRKK